MTQHNADADGDSDGDDVNMDLVVSCLNTFPSNRHLIASAGWNRQFHLWDVRTSSAGAGSGSAGNCKLVATVKLPDAAFSMDIAPSTGNRIVISTAGKRLVIIDMQMPTSSSTTAAAAFNAEDVDANMVLN